MSPAVELLALLGVGVLAGIVSTVASLASIVSYPALLALGLPPVSANVTNTVALMFTGLGAAAGSRPELAGQGRRVLRLGLVTAIGGGVGAALLLLTPSRIFEYAAPVLIAAGSLVILRPLAPLPAAVSPAVVPGPAVPPPAAQPPAVQPPAVQPPETLTREPADRERGWLPRLAIFAVAVYIGYFGAAGGILLLAVLIRMLQQSLARTNAVKNVVSGLANAVAGIAFAIFGPVRWAAVVPLAAGFLIGGWAGPWLVRRLPARGLRVFVGICGLGLAIRLGASAYG
ncbi:MAG TPA: sulfite exporter TauE/SafE family protein [Streptosporangiaceae bacterium]